ncbi:acyl-CoA dehydrogenase [Maricurvus nonylphenolicus]|uniref:acyl-CoA dehydrogenase family protein n=1 Tax=Maricurvus nonylphenolicus TaxID=1008307 RepID=UPI0036F23F31
MSYQPNEEQRMAVDGLRKFLADVIEPQAKEYGDNKIPKELMQDWFKQLVPFGLITAPIAEADGGLGLDWQTHLYLYEELAYSSVDIAVPLAINTFIANSLVTTASEELKQRYLPGLLSGELFGSGAISEPDVGSDVSAVKTRAVRDGDHWVINGEKTWITNGHYSDFIICTCKTGDFELSHILIDRKEHGYESRDIPKIAMNGQSTAQIFLDDVRVPVSNTLGNVGDGLKNTLKNFEIARCHMATWGVGLARRALEESVKYSRERTQHRKPIAGHQMIAEKLATMATKIDAARLLTHRAASLVDEDIRCDVECSMAKWYGTEIAVDAARDAVQIHGGNGLTKEFIVERLVREAIISPIPDGTTEIQKLLISRYLTGISAF